MKRNITVITFIIIIIFIFAPSSVLAATLSLSPSTGTFNRSCNLTLMVNLDTSGAQTDGTDAVIRYDPTRFSATRINPGVIYPDYPGSNIDSAQGKITISGLASVSSPFIGSGTLATIDFTVLPASPVGASNVTFEFDPANLTNTTDSNVVERSTVKDVLSSVTNGNYTIGTSVCSQQTQTGSNQGGGTTTIETKGGGISTPSGTIPVKILPPAGSETLTFTIAIVGGVLTILGIFGLALL